MSYGMNQRSLGGFDKSSKLARAARALVETMERRTLLSATLGADGLLTVTGTDLADRIGVDDFTPSKITVSFYDTSGSSTLSQQSFNASAVKNIVLNALGGNDNAEVDARISGGVTVNGGAGDDLLRVVTATAVINGDAGNDRLMTANSELTQMHITLNGGDGNDWLEPNWDVVSVAGDSSAARSLR